MRKPSMILVSATAVLLLAVALPAAAAAPVVASPPSADLPIPRILHVIVPPAPDPRCSEPRPSTPTPMLLDWWRQWWDAATSSRAERQPDPERPTRTPFYLRSPMLSGFFGWGEPDPCEDGVPARAKTSPRHAPASLPTDADSARSAAARDKS